MKTIGFIGVGELALYTIKGARRGGYQGPILLSPRNHGKAEYLATHHQ
jgi:pyrroline-5-carboxylate reductase